MPGLTLAISSVNHALPPARFEAACAGMMHFTDWQAHLFVNTPNIRAGYVGYPGYPVDTFFPSNGLAFYVEGRIYNKSAQTVRRELTTLGPLLLQKDPRSDERIRDWILGSDGQFVVACIDLAAGSAAVWTDYLNRLPLYWYRDESCALISREPKFIQRLKPDPALDPIACAMNLHFLFPIGDRTLFTGIRRMPAAGLLRVDIAGDRPVRVETKAVYSINLDCEDRDKTPSKHVDEFADLMLEACRTHGNGSGSGTNIISLSGGYDSRVVAASCRLAGIDLVATTFRNTHIQPAREADTARRIAASLDIQWYCFDLPEASVGDLDLLVALKDGLNSIDNAYILEYLRKVVARWGHGATYLTGDGGGYVFKTTALPGDIGSLDAVAALISRAYGYTPIDTVAALCRIHRDDLLNEIHRVVESFPEAHLPKRVMRFKILERGRKMYFEGEDRTKFYLWQAAPLYARTVFMHCMRVPDRFKEGNRWVAAIVRRLSPALARIPVEPLGIAPASPLHPVACGAREVIDGLPPRLRRMTRQLLGRGEAGSVRNRGANALSRSYVDAHVSADHPIWNSMDRWMAIHLLTNAPESELSPLVTILVLAKREFEARAGGIGSRGSSVSGEDAPSHATGR